MALKKEPWIEKEHSNQLRVCLFQRPIHLLVFSKCHIIHFDAHGTFLHQLLGKLR